MSLRESVKPAVRAIHPALFVVGFAVVFVQTGLFFASAFLRSLVSPVVGNVLAPLGTLAVLAVTVPLSVALYVPLDRECEDAEPTLRAAADGLRTHYPTALGATLAALAVSVAVSVAAGLLWVVAGTAIRYGMYLTGDPFPPHPMRTILEVQLVAFATFGIAVLATRFADLFAVFGDATPRDGWRASLRFVRRRPLSFLGYAVLTAVLLGTSNAVANTASVQRPSALVAVLGVVVAVGSVGLVLAAALHVAYYRRTVAATVDPGSRASLRWSRVAAVAVVLVAAVTGAAYVRAVDLETGQEPIRPLPDDPHAAYQVAANNTADADHRYVVRIRNESDPNGAFRVRSRGGVDYDDRQRYVYIHGRDIVLGGYYEEGTIGILNDSGEVRAPLGLFARQSGDWNVLAAPGYGLVAGPGGTPLPRPGANWTLASRNESTLVYRIDDPERIPDGLPEDTPWVKPPFTDDSHVEVSVDRERGVVDAARFELRSRESGRHYSVRVRFESVGTADLERPDAIGPRNPLEWFWDVAYY